MIRDFIGCSPQLDATNFVAETAAVIGDVHLAKDVSIWFGASLRGDVNRISIGERSNVQDNAVVHVTNGTAPTNIGKGVTIGHSAIVHGCTIEDDVLVGMGSIILDKAVIGSRSIIGAGALITSGVIIPPESLVLGSPAKVIRGLRSDEIDSIYEYASNYVRYKNIYLGVERPDTNPFYT
ncbi:MAG: gamma carbonic anhydrase family protein [Bacteroidetes Order II. Incertae sedis bacterium]|jgi:gamma-carbonic anhydrase|nr:gamma carbonic anhydrase family protein [Bacteroidetes Order II. bacterium]MBT4603427.1 gamma carbonic anhydrase family protein [Bacteroidetes Order II. bacterium]MBT5249687.1 gamma carbonic anhydrase family protein [Bacteroidetes Order II. bacterium]MBT6200229.1 gamma carbonic anhydrase family protein [Bacteroidetes Order II. bacterium]MBT6423525.1 gamma carbonic anhydrase family protein [Bacteroidetes Order II. bacterium]